MMKQAPWREFATISVLAVLVAVGAASGDHGAGVLLRDYTPRNDAEAANLRVVRTVAEGWERRDVELILSAYAPDAVQRAWHEPDRMTSGRSRVVRAAGG